jgi:succinyl-CoA synthetase beta subunit
MARLHEYQAKSLLADAKIQIPLGGPAQTPEDARAWAEKIAGPVVIKAQVWVTGRADLGVIRFANSPQEAALAAQDILGKQIRGFRVDTVLVEEKIDGQNEFYAGVIIDDQAQAPAVIFSRVGGTGIEVIAREQPESVAQMPIDIRRGLLDYQARDLIREVGIGGKLQRNLALLLCKLYQVAHKYDARAAEINPIILSKSGKLFAADCRITIDDYAVYRHPDLGIEIAREFDRPPTKLEKIAWQVEKDDYRGTFYFIQLEHDFARGESVIGFHGAGGGGSMMSMDAVLNRGYKLANFVDTSGNPPASKVYRAARIILSQEGIDGYFASGSGVASQEQFHSARGLAKAFMEHPLSIPAVIRLGGNAEDRAISILERANAVFPGSLEAYGKDDTPDFCAQRLDRLIRTSAPPEGIPKGRIFTEPKEPYRFQTYSGGRVTLDHFACRTCETQICVETCVPGILMLKEGLPSLNITEEQARKGGCTECLACEIECYFEGNRAGWIDLPIAGL